MADTIFIEAILSSYARLVRAIIFFFFLVLIIGALVMLIISSLFQGGDLSVEMNKEGRILYKYSHFRKSEDKSYTTFMLPSNELWYDTGIDLDADQQIKIVISGRIHLAVHKLVDAADKDEKSAVNWNGPEGSVWGNLGENIEQLKSKKSLLVSQGDIIGNTLLYLCPINNIGNFRQDFVKNRKAYIGKFPVVINNQQYINNTGNKVRLFLTVNDILLDFSKDGLDRSKIAYTRLHRPHNFDEIWKANFYDVWFADNVGCFLVNAEITQKKE